MPVQLSSALAAAVLCAWTAVLLAQPPAAPTLTADGARVEATVTRAIDGSSLDARVDGARTALGYLGAEVLPANDPCGLQALERNRELAGTRVLLEDDPTYQFDERGRRLYYAYSPDGRSIEAVLIQEGLAWAVRTDASHGPELAALQAEAQAAGRGCLWAAPGRQLAG